MGLGLTVDCELSSMNAAIRNRRVYVGLDLGQRMTPSAIVILERLEVMPDYTDMLRGVGPRMKYVVRQVERVRLGTPYPEVVKRVKELVGLIVARRGSCVLVVDSSGVGVPVVEMMQAAGMGCWLAPVAITSGEKATETSVPRVQLVTRMQLMAQTGELEIAAGCRHGAALAWELVHLQAERRASRRPGAGSGESDDLALALALACWKAKVR